MACLTLVQGAVDADGDGERGQVEFRSGIGGARPGSRSRSHAHVVDGQVVDVDGRQAHHQLVDDFLQPVRVDRKQAQSSNRILETGQRICWVLLPPTMRMSW